MSLGSFVRELIVEPLEPLFPHIGHAGRQDQAPDAGDFTYGWRAWTLHSTRHWDRTTVPAQKRKPVYTIRSVYNDCSWTSGKPCEASCRSYSKHATPSRDCNCGLSAFHQVADLVRLSPPSTGPQISVIGKVVAWGRVIQHERGWRASHVYPISLAVVCTHCYAAHQLLRTAVYVAYWGYDKQHTLALCFRHGNYLKRKGQVRNKSLDFVSADVVTRTLLKSYKLKPVGLWGLDHGYRILAEGLADTDALWPRLVDGSHGPVQYLTAESAEGSTEESEQGEPATSAEIVERGGR